MTPTRITREDLVTQSVTDVVRAGLADRGYPADRYELLDSFTYEPNLVLEKNLICLGFNFDDGGEQAECGSDLKRRLYTIHFFVLGLSRTEARNLANAIKFILDVDTLVPLKDVSQAGAPEIDEPLIVMSASTQDEPPPASPEPWQQFVWSTLIRVEDYYSASQW